MEVVSFMQQEDRRAEHTDLPSAPDCCICPASADIQLQLPTRMQAIKMPDNPNSRRFLARFFGSWQQAVAAEAPWERCAASKLSAMTEASKSLEQPAIVVLGGSFCPPHAGHVAALEYAKRQAEDGQGCTVVGGFFAAAHDSHVKGKFKNRAACSGQGKKGSGSSSSASTDDLCISQLTLQFDAAQRRELCSLIAASSEWLQATPPDLCSSFGSAKECGQAVVKHCNLPSQTKVITVKGSALPLLEQKDGQTMSSTFVRETIGRFGAETGVQRLRQSGILPDAVMAKRLLEMIHERS
mmetsp:Transcript_46533/g.110670  ORF Transcript_46533/g.110670 Transcript_46533/m.110670 type:complete len:297 (-) Transcript_46533:174-1064(-)